MPNIIAQHDVDRVGDKGAAVTLRLADVPPACFLLYAAQREPWKAFFLPVEPNHLIHNPSTGNDIDTDYTLEKNDTCGGKYAEDDDTQPIDGKFSFVFLSSPKMIQISLDRRDSLHWDAYNCKEAVNRRRAYGADGVH
ncbi:hypothetical protein N0V93_010365 [Gnomoniopsis smithogilvyi]|uniref:Uncharacterized protein n=1 Tax=Gnomoniopsis smithogilvyi TaxID=1191159 RepID=A0A9W9CRR4_9PEZI|nr:hypothetical protein N0V93_010365 [Gnomoniopsis smithogilvyi]